MSCIAPDREGETSMALLSGWRGGLLVGLAVGAGAGFALPIIAPGLGKAARPKIKAAVKTGLLAWERGRVALEELREQADDLVAETMLELASEEAAARAPGTAPAEGTAGPNAAGSDPDSAGSPFESRSEAA
jgi:hypothetical protein